MTVGSRTSTTPSWPTRCCDPDRPTLRPKLIWFNLALTLAVMVLLVIDVVPLPFVFMVGAGARAHHQLPEGAQPGRRDRRARAEHRRRRLDGARRRGAGRRAERHRHGDRDGRLGGRRRARRRSGQYFAVITGILSIPMTFFMSNDAFYFGILPILAESAATYGIDPVEMARASIIGQPVHLQSPLVPAILLLVSLAGGEPRRPPQEGAVASRHRLARDARRRRGRRGDPVRVTGFALHFSPRAA